MDDNGIKEVISALALTLHQEYDEDTVYNVAEELGINRDSVLEHYNKFYEDIKDE